MVGALYGQTLGYEFVNYDDGMYVYDNPIVIKGITIIEFLTAFIQKDAGL